ETVTATLPEKVPAGRMLGFTLTITGELPNGATDPPALAVSQLPPFTVVAVAVKDWACAPRFEISSVCDSNPVTPCDAGKLSAEGPTEIAGPLPPLILIV